MVRLLVAAGALLLFAWLAQEVMRGGTQQFDDRLRALVHAHASPALTAVMRGVSFIGAPGALIPAGAIVVFWLVRAGRPRTAVLFLVTVLGAEALEQLLKLVFRRTRPAAFFGLAEPAGYSFPSGHALVSCAFFGALAVVVAARPGNRARRWTYCVAAALAAAAIGFSRVYLGMHYPTDVLGGYAAALVWLSTVMRARP